MGESGGGRNAGTRDPDKDHVIAELREAVRARDEFVAIAAHELRNPMTPILMQVSLLLSAARDPGRCRPDVLIPRLENLERAIGEFVRRSNTLLDVSRIASGNVKIEPKTVDVSRIVRGVVDRAANAAQLARSRLTAEVDDGITGWLDQMAVEQVTENLVSNALKFGAGREVRVALRSDAHTAQLIVTDGGMGIPEEDHQRIFQRFERGGLQTKHGGFGIGLWLADQLVRAMGGTITIESEPGRGATFIVKLPLDGHDPNGNG